MSFFSPIGLYTFITYSDMRLFLVTGSPLVLRRRVPSRAGNRWGSGSYLLLLSQGINTVEDWKLAT